MSNSKKALAAAEELLKIIGTCSTDWDEIRIKASILTSEIEKQIKRELSYESFETLSPQQAERARKQGYDIDFLVDTK